MSNKNVHVHGPNIFDPNCAACRKRGMPRSKTVNTHLLPDDSKAEFGYHTVEIQKGVLGEISKIREELEELEDAERQGIKIMSMCELADLFGAIRAFALKKYGLKMRDLHDMAKATRNAFEQGYR